MKGWEGLGWGWLEAQRGENLAPHPDHPLSALSRYAPVHAVSYIQQDVQGAVGGLL